MTAIPNNTSPSLSSHTPEQLEKMLKDWIEKHRTFFDVFLDAFCVVDLQNNVVELNTAFEELCGESYRKIIKIGSFSKLLNTELCPDRSPPKQVVTSGRPVRIDELKGSSKSYPELQMILSGIPIFSDDNTLVGSLITIRNVSAENELQKKYDERKKESVTDGLTKLFNKVYSENNLLRVLKSSMRDTHALSVCMIDIDHFKKVNDTHGHQAGDYVIANVARLLKEEGRDTDIIGRFGGEEFIAILANSNKAGAQIFAERFRKRVESTNFEFQGIKIPITVSLGTATFDKPWEDGMDPAEEEKNLIAGADQALYHSKRTGRNRASQIENLTPEQIKQLKQK